MREIAHLGGKHNLKFIDLGMQRINLNIVFFGIDGHDFQ
jgi:hypothetical protein